MTEINDSEFINQLKPTVDMNQAQEVGGIALQETIERVNKKFGGPDWEQLREEILS